jgi:hypothetical protein
LIVKGKVMSDEKCCEDLRATEMRLKIEIENAIREIEELKKNAIQIEELKKSVESLNKSVEGLVTAWETGTGLVAFIKWFAPLVFILSSLWQVAKQFMKGT